MEKEEILLGEEMGRLEIEPVKFVKNRSNDNPFVLHKKNYFKNPVLPVKETKCTCSVQKKIQRSGIYKRKPNKIINEPVLKVLRNCGINSPVLNVEQCKETLKKNKLEAVGCDPLNLCVLVSNCNQLTISSTSNEQNLKIQDVNSNHKWWKKEVTNSSEHREPKQQNSHSRSCSQQALNPPCDITIDELASYFETLVHIPKKMSTMAEMMYI